MSQSQIPVAVFVGGTSGIGRAMAEAFAERTNGHAHIFIIGRNKAAAKEIIRSFPKPKDTDVIHEFISSDVSLISNVHKTTSVLLNDTRIEKIDYLVLSSGLLMLAGRNETQEGIDNKMALSYYSRWTFVHDLLPLLRESEHAKIYSVLGAGKGGPIDMEDLDLKKSHTIGKCLVAVSVYTDLMMQKLAKEEPKIAFNHAFPGLVRSPMMTPSRWWLKVPYYLVYPIFSFMSITPEASGKIHISCLMTSEAGFNNYGPQGESIPYTPAEESVVEGVWKHTLQVTEALRV